MGPQRPSADAIHRMDEPIVGPDCNTFREWTKLRPRKPGDGTHHLATAAAFIALAAAAFITLTAAAFITLTALAALIALAATTLAAFLREPLGRVLHQGRQLLGELLRLLHERRQALLQSLRRQPLGGLVLLVLLPLAALLLLGHVELCPFLVVYCSTR